MMTEQPIAALHLLLNQLPKCRLLQINFQPNTGEPPEAASISEQKPGETNFTDVRLCFFGMIILTQTPITTTAEVSPDFQ